MSVFACTNDDVLFVETENKLAVENTLGNKRTFEEAISIAQNALEIFNSPQTRSGGKKIDFSKVQYVVDDVLTRNGNADTLMYVFNYEDNQGYAIVSANKKTEALIAVTERGTYSEESEKECPGLALYMDMAREYTTTSFDGPSTDTGDFDHLVEHKFEAIRDTFYHGPYVDVKWGQGEPYNNNCPIDNGVRCPTGCAATAIAQILSYYEYPGSIYGQTYNWSELKQHNRSTYNNQCACSSNNHNNLARLFRDIGDGVDMRYSSTGSGSSIYEAADFLMDLDFLVDGPSSFNQTKINDEVRNGRAVYIRGENHQNNKVSGHAWVLDGLMNIKVTSNEYERPFGQLLWTLVESITTYTYYNHFNWGWNGNNNGYFLSNVFDVTQYKILDEGSVSTEAYNLEHDVQILTNIKIPVF